MDDETVKPHARRCMAAFQIVKKEEIVNGVINDSKDMISKKGTNLIKFFLVFNEKKIQMKKQRLKY